MALTNPAEDHAIYLATIIGITGYTLAGNLFYDKKLDTPSAAIFVFNTKAHSSLMTLSTSDSDIRRPGLMIHVRGNPGDYAGTRAIAEIVYSALAKKGNYTVNGKTYLSCLAVGELGAPEYDEQNRPQWYLNFELKVV